ncbi:hypothetical protein niasHS_005842 [Heterodera schachtii]|uniref:Uncharacterized protein n=1 Tax=Heterodera schachtii TaxID=97005 RepID=A0ABD2K096_HETSC
MVRVSGSGGERFPSRENGGSPSTFQMEKQEKRKNLFKWAAFFAALLCVLFLVATIVLALKLGLILSEKNGHKTNNGKNSGEQQQSVNGSVKGPKQMEEDNSPTDQITVGESVDENVNEDNDNGNNSVALTPRAHSARVHLKWPSPTGSMHAQYRRAAVATDHGLCSEIGRDVLLEGGNSVDSMIASLLCIGVVNPQSSGLGGGFIMTLYNTSTQRCTTIDARETAPLGTNSTMYVGTPRDSVIGYRSIAVPGELHGFWTAFTKFGSGRVTWKRLFEPAIKLARFGFPVSSNLAMVLQQKEDDIEEDQNLKRIFVDKKTGRVFEEGDIMTRERLAELLDELAVAPNPIELFYKGGIAQTISAEIKENGGYVSVEDLEQYESVIHETPLESELLSDELVMCGPPAPSSFAIAQAIIGVMAHFYRDEKVNLDDPLVYHRLVEVQKFAYAQRTKLGDSAFVKNARLISRNMTKHAFSKWIASLIPEKAQPLNYYSLDLTGHVPDHGTSHVVAIDHEGNAISATSTINQLLGSKRVSPTLGIIWNDQMDDFSTPNMTNLFGFAPSPTNYIVPKKRPMSSMSPMIVYNKNNGKVKMAVGGSGGSRIISAVAQTVIRALIFNQTIKESVDAPRFHNQFLPPFTEYEESIPQPLIKFLVEERNQNMTAIEKQPSVVQALIVMEDGFIHGNSDFRRKTATYPAGY